MGARCPRAAATLAARARAGSARVPRILGGACEATTPESRSSPSVRAQGGSARVPRILGGACEADAPEWRCSLAVRAQGGSARVPRRLAARARRTRARAAAPRRCELEPPARECAASWRRAPGRPRPCGALAAPLRRPCGALAAPLRRPCGARRMRGAARLLWIDEVGAAQLPGGARFGQTRLTDAARLLWIDEVGAVAQLPGGPRSKASACECRSYLGGARLAKRARGIRRDYFGQTK